jgi:hypothetical protein
MKLLEAILIKCLLAFAVSMAAAVSMASFGGQSMAKSQSKDAENEQALWTLEHEYWRDVQENNLPAYLRLWHKDFLGWPWVSATPVRKEHITDWITSQTSKGLAFKTDEFKQAGMQRTGDIAVTYYWITYRWLDKAGNGATLTTRITHTWLKDANNDWHIIGGMSMKETAPPGR